MLNIHQRQITYANSHQSILVTGHLYLALKQKQLLSQSWVEMDVFIALHGKELLLEETPQTPNHYSLLMVARGASVENFASNRRKPGVLASKRGPHQIKASGIPLSFLSTLCAPVISENDASRSQLEMIAQMMSKERESEKGNTSKAKKNPVSLFDPIKLLQFMEKYMAREEPKLLFNPINLYIICWQALATIECSLHSEFERHLGEQPTNISSYLYLLPQFVLEKSEPSRLKIAAETLQQWLSDSQGGLNQMGTMSGIVEEVNVLEIGAETPDHVKQNRVCIHWGPCNTHPAIINVVGLHTTEPSERDSG